MTDRPISPAGPYPHDVAAPTPPRRLTPGAVPWRGRRLSCPVAATLAECDATGEEAADVYAAHYAEAQATIARLEARGAARDAVGDDVMAHFLDGTDDPVLLVELAEARKRIEARKADK